ncbi:MAG: sn-glycerol-3-phosphate ABC transporter ATP-binding protein UgpC [Parvularculales bacterium]
MSGVNLEKAIKRYGDVQVIHGVDLQVEPGEFCVFVGPSGCGKSTLLRMIAGLEETSEGKISIGEKDVTNVDAADRGIAMVFQTYALYPHMTVRENIGFGLKMNGVDKDTIKSKVDEVSSILKLGDYMDRKPKALSGGQRQRVAIGRALVRGPEVFLFDEPLSNLDAELRVDMRVEIARLHQEIGATMIYVTHDQVEAMTLADKIVVLRSGVVEQVGTPLELYTDPDNKFVGGFIGSPSMNFVSGQAKGGKITCKDLPDHSITAPKSASGNILLGLRPEHLQLDPKGNSLTVQIVEQLGGVTYVYAHSADGERLIIEHKNLKAPKFGDKIGVKFNAKDVYLFDAKSEKRIR